jgi:hypothetical protein
MLALATGLELASYNRKLKLENQTAPAKLLRL